MSLIFGIVSKNQAPTNSKLLDSMMKAIPEYSFDLELRLTKLLFCFGKKVIYNTPESRFSTQFQYRSINNIAVLFDGRIDNREDIARELSISKVQLSIMPDEELLALGYKAWGEEFCKKILGDFALVVVSEDTVLVCRDHIGARPLYLSENDDYLVFSSNKRALLTVPWVSREQNTQWIADLICMVKVDKDTTYYKDISAMLPAHYRVYKIGQHQHTNSVKQYWSLEITQNLNVYSDYEIAEQFRVLLDDAVRCRLRSAYPVATELSGGLDSTNIAATANRWIESYNNHPLIACSHVFSPELKGKVFPYYDESDQITQFIDINKIAIWEPVATKVKSSKECIEQNVKRHGGPSRSDLTQYGSELFDTLKLYNARVLLSGYGGDQLVSSFAMGAREEMIADGLYKELWRDISAAHHNIRAGYRFLLCLLKANFPAIEALVSKWRKGESTLLNDWDYFLSKIFIQPDFAKLHGFPERHFDYPPWLQTGSVRERELYLVERATLTYRVEDSAVSSEYYGVEYRYPLLDRRLMEFCFSLPLNQKYRNGSGRRMMRVNGKGIIPESTRLQQSKVGTGSTIPAANYSRVRDKNTLANSIISMSHHLGEIEHVDIDKMISYANSLTANPDRKTSAIPRSFDKAYQVLYTQAQGSSL